MADLGAVLRKTIDGLPNATPQLRAKVYDKARAAIRRQIDGADPKLPDEVAKARLAALDEAVERTEAHYAAGDAERASAPAPEPPAAAASGVGDRPAPAGVPATSAVPPAGDGDAPSRASPPKLPPATFGPPAPGGFSALVDGPGDGRASPAARGPEAPAFPAQAEEPESMARPAAVPAPFAPPRGLAESRPPAPGDERALDFLSPKAGGPAPAAEEPPRRRPQGPSGRAAPRRSRRPLAVAATLLVLIGGAGALAWTYYGEEIETLVAGTLAGFQTAAVDPAPAVTGNGTAGTASSPPAAVPAAAPAASTGEPATAAPAPAGEGTRRFTQRLLPDGTEVDEGPGVAEANAFDEGTQIAAASLAEPEAEATAQTPTIESQIGQDPVVVGAPGTQTAAVTDPAAGAAPEGEGGAVPVGQKAVFYEERSESEPGTQQTGGVVWSVVNEPPAEGQPAEPAIRAVASVPDEALTLTLTIRRNADPTLPASHVIELLFDTPADFDGGSIANVQRLALKPTEQARGEPLIGVAGKISDGFFIIALNNLEQAVQNNLSLLGSEQWIDIPVAYQTGRRALMSIEKGIPGERVFKETMDAWAATTAEADASTAG